LERCGLVDDMIYWLIVDIHDVDNDIVVKLMVVVQGEFEPSWRFPE
jgi:hypothetical protein